MIPEEVGVGEYTRVGVANRIRDRWDDGCDRGYISPLGAVFLLFAVQDIIEPATVTGKTY